MNRRILIPLLVLSAIFAFCLWNAATMEGHTQHWQIQLQISEALARNDSWPAALDALSESHADWARSQTYLHVVTGHGDVDEAEALYRRCLAYAAAEEDSEFFAEIASLQEQLRLLSEMEKLSYRNIF